MKVGIIGAGYSGLYAAKLFSTNPDFEITVLEQQSEVGGLWCYTPETGNDKNGLPLHPSMYESLRTHVPKQLMAFSDFPFEHNKNLPTFVHHTTVLKYLQDYAAKFALLKYIQFNVRVKAIKRLEKPDMDARESQWQVTSARLTPDSVGSDGETEVFVFDKLIVCTGNHALAEKPDVPGLDSFPGQISHSHDYRNNSPFQNQTVILAGAGLSGVDLSQEIGRVATKVILVNPRRVQLANCKKAKHIVEEQGYVSRVEGSTVHLSNGNSYPVDAIMFCTGYRISDYLFDPNCEITYHNRRLMPFYKFLVHIKYPSLAVISFVSKVIPTITPPIQMQFLKKLWEGRFTLPSEEDMVADADAQLQRHLDMGFSPHYAHFLFGKLQFNYIDQLSQIADLEPLAPYKKKLLLYALDYSVENPEHYRDTGVDILNDNDYELYPESREVLEMFRN